MGYYESAEGITITQERAKQEVCRVHNLAESEWLEFLSDMGDKPTYDAQKVLEWLGY